MQDTSRRSDYCYLSDYIHIILLSFSLRNALENVTKPNQTEWINVAESRLNWIQSKFELTKTLQPQIFIVMRIVVVKRLERTYDILTQSVLISLARRKENRFQSNVANTGGMKYREYKKAYVCKRSCVINLDSFSSWLHIRHRNIANIHE